MPYMEDGRKWREAEKARAERKEGMKGNGKVFLEIWEELSMWKESLGGMCFVIAILLAAL